MTSTAQRLRSRGRRPRGRERVRPAGAGGGVRGGAARGGGPPAADRLRVGDLPPCRGRGRDARGPVLPAVLEAPETLGGAGTPAVAAFTAEPLAVACGIAPSSATALLADALDLHHRLPVLWQQTQAGFVPAWKARRVAARTRDLSLDAALWVDRQTAGRVGSLGSGCTGPVGRRGRRPRRRRQPGREGEAQPLAVGREAQAPRPERGRRHVRDPRRRGHPGPDPVPRHRLRRSRSPRRAR